MTSLARVHTLIAKVLLFGLMIGLVGPLEVAFKPVASAEFDEGGVRANTLMTNEAVQLKALPQADLDGQSAAYETQSTYLSPAYEADFTFDAVELNWEQHQPEGTHIEIQVRFDHEQGDWSQWFDLHDNVDYRDGSAPDLEAANTLVPTDRSTAIQYRVELQGEGPLTPRVQDMAFHYIDSTDPGKAVIPDDKETELTSQARLIFGDDEIDIISREEWGADPEWLRSRYYGSDEDDEPEVDIEEDDAGKTNEEPTLEELYPEEFEILRTISKDSSGNELYWPVEHPKNIEKIFIHHTAGELTTDAASAVRAIYYYHAVRRGWGDIGYNYIIANGEIYEGRYGGKGAVGGHTQGYNTGSIGIAVIGNYEYEQPAMEDLEAISTLLAYLSDEHDINIKGYGQFRGDYGPNVLGHRDAGSTRCPGENLYKMLPVIRELVAEQVKGTEVELSTQYVDDPFEFASVSAYNVIQLLPGDEYELELQLKNVGENTWTDDTYLTVHNNSSAESLVHLERSSGNTDSVAYLQEDEVERGEVGTFTVTMEAKWNAGFENFDITPVFNGKTRSGHSIDMPVYVSHPEFTYDVVDVDIEKSRIKVGEDVEVTVVVENTGNTKWSRGGDYPVRLATTNPQDRESQFLDNGENRYSVMDEVYVEKGETATFNFTLTAPDAAGVYTEYATLVADGLTWMTGETIDMEFVVYNPQDQLEVASTSSSIYEPGERGKAWIRVENIGVLDWAQDDFSIGTIHHPDIHMTTPQLTQSEVEPGETGKIEFYISVPEESGSYQVYLRPRLNGVSLVRKNIPFSFVVEGNSSVSTSSAVTSYSQSHDSSQTDDVRVKLSYDESTHGNPVISANHDFEVALNDERFFIVSGGDEVEVRRMDDQYQLLHNNRGWIVDDVPQFLGQTDDTIFTLENYENRPTWNTSLNDNQFRGDLEVRQESGELIVINTLPMNDYLKGVAESTNSEPAEKQKVMAILARTYMQYYLEKDEKFPGKPYDASDDPDVFQKYLGYGFEQRASTWIAAVDATEDLVVTYNGELVKTPYFSSTDGTVTKSAQDVWGWSHTPYLISVPDPLCGGTAYSGHGVGLSGCGATAAAEQGHGYEDIIKYYYTGVEIERH